MSGETATGSPVASARVPGGRGEDPPLFRSRGLGALAADGEQSTGHYGNDKPPARVKPGGGLSWVFRVLPTSGWGTLPVSEPVAR